MTKQWRRLTAAAVISLVSMAGAASPALAADPTLTVSIAGAGSVAGSGISCSRTIAGTVSGTCSRAYPSSQDCDYSGPKPPCHTVYGEASLTPTPPAGFTFDHWAGDCTGAEVPCTLEMTDDHAVTAVFRDSAPPTVTLSAPGSGAVAGRISLSANASDNVAVTKVEFSVRGVVRATVTSAPYSASLDTSVLADGPAAVTATAYDTSGNMTVSSTANLTIDNTKPTLVVNGPDGQTFGANSTQTWTLSAADATSGLKSVQCSLVTTGTPASFGSCTGGTGSHTVSGRPAGDYTFTARATDNAGNAVDVTRAFTVDTTAPHTSISGPPPAKSAGTIAFAFTSSKPNSTFQCRLDAPGASGTYSACSSPITYSGLVAGNYRFHVVATDAVGNKDPFDATWDFQVDTTPPETTITGGPAGSTTEASPSFTFSSPDGSALFQCQMDGGAFAPCTSPQAYDSLAPGDHVFVVRAVDPAGNVDETPASRAFTVAAPVTSGDGDPGSGSGSPAGGGDPGTGAGSLPVATSGGGSSPFGGGAAAGLPQLTATLAYDYVVKGRTTRFITLKLKNLPAGATVKVVCKKGCPITTLTKAKAPATLSLTALLRKPIKAGATIAITISKPGFVPAVKTLTIRANQRPKLTTT